MRSLGTFAAAGILLVSTDSVAQSRISDRAPPGSAVGSLTQVQRWFELEAPFSRPLRIRFDTRPVPTYETLHLPTFEGRGTLLESASFNVSLFERVAPAIELDCLRTCAPVLEHSLGVEGRLSLGAMGPRVPASYLSIGTGLMRMPWGFGTKTMLNFGGLLNL